MQSFLVVSSILLWMVVGFNLLLTLALVRKLSTGPQVLQGLKAGAKAPDFNAHTLDGKTVTLANYLGKPVAFLFISPHCKPCKEKIPEYQMIFPQARNAGVELVLVGINNPLADIQAMVNEFKIEIPVLFAPQENNSFTKDYKVGGSPFYCVINENGKVISSGYPSIEAGGEWKLLTEAWRNDAKNAIQSAFA